MGKVVWLIRASDRDRIKESVRKTVVVRLAYTYYGIPRKKPDSFDKLLRIWPCYPESLKAELRPILAPAFRKKALIMKDEKLIQEVDDYLTEFEQRHQETDP